tara:strand:- start:1202 stop:1792 length:591 start_codon:yes stop_codon:yes gene_type:complete
MSDKERHFVMVYCVHHNASDAARQAGYASPGSAAAKLLKRPHVMRAIGRAEAIMVENLGIDAEEVLYQLWCCLTRSLSDFTDETGKIITDVRNLTPRARHAVDSVKQKVTRKRNIDGTTTETIENELKLVPKASAIQMAMQHKGLFAPEKVQEIKGLDWDTMYQDGSKRADIDDPIEARIAAVKPEEQDDGNYDTD